MLGRLRSWAHPPGEGLEVRAMSRQADQVRVVDVVTADPEASQCPGLQCGL